MIQVSREPPKCKNCNKVLEWLPWKNGKPQRPVDPVTKQPCECWKTSGRKGGDSFKASGRMFDKKDKYKECEYCDGWYHIDDKEEHELHLEVYHKDKKKHKGSFNIGESCFEDEILYRGTENTWFNNTYKVDKKDVKDFANKHGIKVIRDEYLL